MINKEFLEVLACPACKEDILYIEKENCFICKNCLLKFPVVDDIPDFLLEDAVKISEEEVNKLSDES